MKSQIERPPFDAPLVKLPMAKRDRLLKVRAGRQNAFEPRDYAASTLSAANVLNEAQGIAFTSLGVYPAFNNLVLPTKTLKSLLPSQAGEFDDPDVEIDEQPTTAERIKLAIDLGKQAQDTFDRQDLLITNKILSEAETRTAAEWREEIE